MYIINLAIIIMNREQLFIILSDLLIIIVDEVILEKPPKMDDAYAFLKKVSVQWNTIGAELNVSYDYRQQLFREGVMSTSEQKLEGVLNKWVESKCSEVTWKHFLDMLKSVELNRIAEEVREFLQKPDIIKKYNS